jgi:hypothetical protein
MKREFIQNYWKPSKHLSKCLVFTNIVLNTETLLNFHSINASWYYNSALKNMEMRKMIILIVLFVNGIIVFYACKKEKEPEPVEYDHQSSQDNALAEAIFSDVNNIANQAVEEGTLTTYKLGEQQNTILSTCATVNINPDSTGGGTVTVDFGDYYCKCVDQRYRKGKINITYTGPYATPGSIITTTFDNYYVGLDSNLYKFKVEGTKTVTNNGTNASGNLNFSVNVTGAQITSASGAIMSWTSSRNREWKAGSGTPVNWTDDEYIITGSASGTNFEGTTYTANITSGLHVALNCRWIKQGVFELTPTGKPTRIFDYGSNTCDDDAIVTVNGTVFPIKLR